MCDVTGRGGDCGVMEAQTSPAWSPAVALLYVYTALAGCIVITLPLQSLGEAPGRPIHGNPSASIWGN